MREVARRSRVRAGAIPALLLSGALLAACGDPPPSAPAPAAPGPSAAIAAAPTVDGAAVARGTDLYRRNCQACHGADGKGDGPLAVHLLPRPRDFFAAQYRITSTLQRQPTDGDLLRTLRRGVPGTGMPSFGHLPDADLSALVAKLKSFAETPIRSGVDPADPGGTGPIPIPREPPDDQASRERGRALYAEACAACHGITGRGDGQQVQVDNEGFPTWPRNFGTGEWKGGSSAEEIYRRVAGGMRGSPMPASPVDPGDTWHLVHWVRSIADLDPDERNVQKRLSFRARRVEGDAPLDPFDPAWERAGEQWVSLMALWMRRTPRIQGLRAAFLHDGTRVAVRLRWEDATKDESTFGQQEFRDAVALQVSADADPPFFGMGGGEKPGTGSPVALWMWKADRQADAAGRGDLQHRFPAMAGDGYPREITKSGLIVPELPLEGHATLFLGGKAAGNGVSDLSGEKPAENLSARGAGTVGFRRGGAPVEARGEWRDGSWFVVVRRTLADEGEGAVALAPARPASVAFALWNGSDRDRNGIKSVTVWHDLVVEEGSR